jgi:protein-S-isoprenylcysteine O-methyltransferase Ste14
VKDEKPSSSQRIVESERKRVQVQVQHANTLAFIRVPRKRSTMAPQPQQTSAHAAVFYKTSECLGILHFLSAWIFQRWKPYTLEQRTVFRVSGILILLAGIVLLRRVHAELYRYSQPHVPGVPTTKLINTGPFHYSRNPTYAAISFLVVPALGLLMRNLWIIFLQPAHMIAVYFVLIRDEESYLRTKFGSDWDRYCARTRRWI